MHLLLAWGTLQMGVLLFQDESSYVAGERAALLRAFRETLPSQQALGSLFHAVQHLTKRMDQEGSDVHQVRHAFQAARRLLPHQGVSLLTSLVLPEYIGSLS